MCADRRLFHKTPGPGISLLGFLGFFFRFFAWRATWRGHRGETDKESNYHGSLTKEGWLQRMQPAL